MVGPGASRPVLPGREPIVGCSCRRDADTTINRLKGQQKTPEGGARAQPWSKRRNVSMSSLICGSVVRRSSILRIAYITVVWSRPPNLRPISGRERGRQLLGQIHRHLARPGDRARPARRVHVGDPDAVVLGDAPLDLLDGHPPLVGAQQILQDLLRQIERDRAPDQGRLRDDPVQGALELADVRGDPAGEELEHRLRDLDLLRDQRRLGPQDLEPQLVGGGVNVDDQPPAQARADPLLEAGQLARATVRRDHDLPATVDQGVEGVKELLLGGLLAADELDVVDHQDVGRAEQLLEAHGVLEAQRLDELIHELLGGQVDHAAHGVLPADLPGDGVHQVGLAEADAAMRRTAG